MIIFFEWGKDRLSNAVWRLAMCPYIIIPTNRNCEYEMDFENEIIKIKTIRLIKEGEGAIYKL